MENILCLIGFSGDDPNFYYWTGWVRDYLGNAANNIYLLGFINHSKTFTNYLFKKKIIPINLFSFFSDEKDNCYKERKKKAISCFLSYLASGEPPNPYLWGRFNNGGNEKDNNNTLKHERITFTNPDHLFPKRKGGKEKIEKYPYENWKKIREEDPGWVVDPAETRKSIWNYTTNWIYDTIENNPLQDKEDYIFIIYELIWRINISLMPLFSNWSDKINKIIRRYNPFPEIITIDESFITPKEDRYKHLDWDRIKIIWIDILFALIREARDAQNIKYFEDNMSIIVKIKDINPDWNNRFFYENCLFYINRRDLVKVKNYLRNWSDFESHPFWTSRKASIIAEIGDIDEAERLVRNTLNNIRHSITYNDLNEKIISQEKWTLLLLKIILRCKFSNEFIDENQGLYNPLNEIINLGTQLYGERPSPKPPREIKKKFDPLKFTETTHFDPGLTIGDFLPAFSLLRIYEEGGVPLRCGILAVYSEYIFKAFEWVYDFIPYWTFCSMIRTGSLSNIINWERRELVYLLDNDFINQIFDLLIKSTKQFLNLILDKPDITNEQNSYLVNHFCINVELLSLLTIKLDYIKKTELLNFSIELYNDQYVSDHHWLFIDPISNLFKRVFFSLEDKQIIENISTLLSLSLKNKLCEPFDHIKWTNPKSLGNNYDRSKWDKNISYIIKHVNNKDPKIRKRAIQRIIKLFLINSLTEVEIKLFAESLWSQLDKDQIPLHTGLMVFSFLNLPSEDNKKSKVILYNYLLKSDFERVISYSNDKISRSFSGPKNKDLIDSIYYSTKPYFIKNNANTSNYIEWSLDNIKTIFDKIISWWDDEKDELNIDPLSYAFTPFKTVKESFEYLIPLLREVIFSRISTKDKENKVRAVILLKEMENKGLAVLSVWPTVLFFDSTYYDEIVSKIRSGIISTNENVLRESIISIYFWYANIIKYKNKIKRPPIDLLNEFISRIRFRIEPELGTCLFYCHRIIDNMPSILEQVHFSHFLLALEYLKDETVPEKAEIF